MENAIWINNDVRSEGTTRQQLIDEFARSAAYSAVQSPLDGVTQLASKVSGQELPKLHLVDAPVEADFGSARWHAQQLGAGVGMSVPFLMINKGLGLTANSGLAAAEVGLGRKVATAAASGFVFDSVFRPVADAEMDQFALARLKHGLVGAGTFAGITAAQGALSGTQARMAGLRSASELRVSLARDTFNHVVAGGGMGALNAQADSILSGKGLASLEDTGKSAYQFAFVGATMGAYNHFEGALSRGNAKRVDGRAEGKSGTTTNALHDINLAREGYSVDGLQVRLRNDVGLVNKDAPASWLVPGDAAQYEAARARAVELMKKVYDGEPYSMHDLLQQAVERKNLTPEQARAYEYFMGDIVHGFEQRGNQVANEKSTQIGNMQHTLREARSILKDPAIQNTTPENVFKALLGSAMSDARKPVGFLPVANHAYVAAAEVSAPLGRALDTAFGGKVSAPEKAQITADVSNIVLEHHLQGPRQVLTNIFHMPLIRQSIAAEINGRMAVDAAAKDGLAPLVERLNSKEPVSLTDAERIALSNAGMKGLVAEIDGLPVLQDKHLNGENHLLIQHYNGPQEVLLTPAEKASLRRLGISGLFLPNPEAHYFKASQIASAADQVQYVTGIERSIKYDAMFGPEFGGTKQRRAYKLGDGSADAESTYTEVRPRLSAADQHRLDGLMQEWRQILPVIRNDFVSQWSAGKTLYRDAQGNLPFHQAPLKWVDASQTQPLSLVENTELAKLHSAAKTGPAANDTRYNELLERKFYEQAVDLNAAWVQHLIKMGETKGSAK